MIVVIADDLSGAAELTGAALRHGLSAEVQTSFDPGSDAEVVCVDTDSRALAPAAARDRVAEVARRVVAAKPAWIFKKCDSVLRGSVLAEARAVATAAGQARILLVPANPSRGRTIRDGIYRIEGRPLHETPFAHDPTHPRWTAEVRALLGGDLSGVSLPDIAAASDVLIQAGHIDASTLPAGGLDFFSALLAARTPAGTAFVPPAPPASSTLVVCGSQASWPRRAQEAGARDVPVFPLPHDLPAAVRALGSGQTVLIGIGDGPTTREVPPPILAARLAQSVVAILDTLPVERLLLEGGATSAAVIGAFGWTRLRAEQPADSGIGVLRPMAKSAPLLVVKPGSYAWPAAFWP